MRDRRPPARRPRVLAWDLYNEPGNEMVFVGMPSPHSGGPLFPHSLELTRAAFAWARSARPSQPLTTGVWNPATPEENRLLLDLSDFSSFHNYLGLDALAAQVEVLRAERRPIVCTEWMARTLGSRAETHLPFFRGQRVGCFCWGLVNGRSQTHLAWPGFESGEHPGLWFHDLLHPDGRPYDLAEAALFRREAAAARARPPDADASRT